MRLPVATAIVPVDPPSPTAAAPPATSPSIRSAKRPGSLLGTSRFVIVIEPPGHFFEFLLADALFPVSDQVSSEPSNSTWKRSSTRPAANAVGWPRFGGAGENVFWSPVASTVVPFVFS